MDITRRSLLLSVAQLAGLNLLSACTSNNVAGLFATSPLNDLSPIDQSYNIEYQKFAGDQPDLAHFVLRDKLKLTAESDVPKPRENTELLIVGGGISGLTCAYVNRAANPIVLEQAARFGGNSKAISFDGVVSSIGAAYFLQPEAGSRIDQLLSELQIDCSRYVVPDDQAVFLDGRLIEDFWLGQSDLARKNEFKFYREYFQSILDEANAPYPNIPLVGGPSDLEVTTLDRLSFKDHLEKVNSANLHPHIHRIIEQYCWSSFGGSASEISAAAGLNFFAAEFGKKIALPGGNAEIAQRLFSKLIDAVGLKSLRAQSLVFRVQQRAGKIWVSYIDSNQQVVTIAAEKVVMACPKFVLPHIIPDLEAPRLEAISRLSYRAYIVANVLISKSYKFDFYDRYLSSAKAPLGDLAELSNEQGATDVIWANYANSRQGQTVLTLYRAFPYQYGRAQIYLPNAFEVLKSQFLQQLTKQILPTLGVRESEIKRLHLTRWGHPLPLAKQGFFSSADPMILSSQWQSKVFFAEQDNWALPCFETAIEEAINLSFA